jgi:cytochrome c oxidase subunit 3
MDVLSESFRGEYTFVVVSGLKVGMVLFILREVCFFAAFFWSFFHSSLSPTQGVGGVWPPFSICSFNPFHGPLLNTLVLLRSGVSVTWAHHGLIGCTDWVLPWLVTILLGVYFTFLQGMEYFVSSFSIRDSVFGAGFYVATGFHGLHVIVGTLFLSFSIARILSHAFTSNCCLGLEMSIWY